MNCVKLNFRNISFSPRWFLPVQILFVSEFIKGILGFGYQIITGQAGEVWCKDKQ